MYEVVLVMPPVLRSGNSSMRRTAIHSLLYDDIALVGSSVSILAFARFWRLIVLVRLALWVIKTGLFLSSTPRLFVLFFVKGFIVY